MAGSFVSVQKWALLIGVDFYMTGNARKDKFGSVIHYPSLRGCVNDIALIECFLKDEIGLTDEHIFKITSTGPDTGGQAVPKEDPSSWPTYQNISQAFHEVLDKARPGDLVYIHYSGHGARVQTAYRNLKGHDGIDEALVPLDIEVLSEGAQSKYVRDVDIACWLQSFVDKRLRTTVVIDSCHSGSTNRTKGSATPRGTGILDCSMLPSDVVNDNGLTSDSSLATPSDDSRHGRVQRNWLLEPHGYTFLAACSTFQRANEYQFAEKVHGALTYYLIDALRSGPSRMPLSALHSRICVNVQSHFAGQTPILDGEDGTPFFSIEEVRRVHHIRVSVVNDTNNQVELDHGGLHGVCKGAEYSIFSDDDSPNSGFLARILVTKVLGLKSVATFIHTAESDEKAVRPGFRASLLKQAPEKVAAVRLVALYQTALNSESKIAWLDDFRRHIEQLTTSPSFWRLLGDDDKASPAAFSVTVTSGGYYELWDASEARVPELPPIHAHDLESADHLADCISHVAQFRLVQRLAPDLVSALKTLCAFQLKGKFTVLPEPLGSPRPEDELVSPAGLETVELADGAYTIRQGEAVSIEFQNHGIIPVYFAVLDLKPLWGIEKIYPAGAGWSECVGPGETRTLPIQMDIPQPLVEKGRFEITETLKAVVTLHSVALGALELPNLGAVSLRGGLPPDFTTRLDQLLRDLSPADRLVTPKWKTSGGSWQVYEIRIRTVSGTNVP